MKTEMREEGAELCIGLCPYLSLVRVCLKAYLKFLRPPTHRGPQDNLSWTCACNYSTVEAAVCHLMCPEKQPPGGSSALKLLAEGLRDFVESRLRPGRKN